MDETNTTLPAYITRLSRLRAVRFARRANLRNKILAFSFALIGLLVASDLIIDAYLDHAQTERQAAAVMANLAANFSNSLTNDSSPIEQLSFAAAARIMNVSTLVDDVYILDREGDVIAESHENGEGRVGAEMRDPLVLRTMIVRKPTATIENDIVTAVAPLARAESGIGGYVVLRGRISSEEEGEALYPALLLAAVLLVVGGLLALVFSRSLTRSIEELTSAAKRIADGNFERPVEIDGHDEFAILATALNRMMRRTSRSIADYERVQGVLKAALHQAEAGSRAKSEFLAGMSHELRTPLNAIIGFSDLLIDKPGALNEVRASEYAHDINRSGRHLLTLVSDILDYARLDAAETDLAEGRVDVGHLLRLLVGEFQPLASASDIALSADSAPDTPTIRGDGEKLHRAIGNLVANALRFTSQGGFVAVSSLQGEDGGLVIRVADNGAGVAPGALNQATAPFEHLGRQVNRSGGLGLGLPLARKLIAMHQGELCVDSSPGAGTTVTVFFPVTRNISPRLPTPAVA